MVNKNEEGTPLARKLMTRARNAGYHPGIKNAEHAFGHEEHPTMKIKRIEHVAVAVKSISAMRDILENKLGIPMEYDEHLPEYSTTLAMFPVGETYIELLESDRADTGTSKWIAEHGEGLFHICLEVEDIDAAVDELRGKGMTFLQDKPRLGHGNSRIIFLDPKATGNLLIELAELPADHQPHSAE